MGSMEIRKHIGHIGYCVDFMVGEGLRIGYDRVDSDEVIRLLIGSKGHSRCVIRDRIGGAGELCRVTDLCDTDMSDLIEYIHSSHGFRFGDLPKSLSIGGVTETRTCEGC